jgi:hypothetical protein
VQIAAAERRFLLNAVGRAHQKPPRVPFDPWPLAGRLVALHTVMMVQQHLNQIDRACDPSEPAEFPHKAASEIERLQLLHRLGKRDRDGPGGLSHDTIATRR